MRLFHLVMWKWLRRKTSLEVLLHQASRTIEKNRKGTCWRKRVRQQSFRTTIYRHQDRDLITRGRKNFHLMPISEVPCTINLKECVSTQGYTKFVFVTKINPWVFEAWNESLVSINLFTTENTPLHIANELRSKRLQGKHSGFVRVSWSFK